MSAERIVHIDMSRYTEEQATKMIASATEAIRSQAQQLTPVDTGNLRRSFSTRVRRLEGEVSNSASYAPYVEYGAVRGTVRMSAQPFLRPAFDSVARRISRYWGQA